MDAPARRGVRQRRRRDRAATGTTGAARLQPPGGLRRPARHEVNPTA